MDTVEARSSAVQKFNAALPVQTERTAASSSPSLAQHLKTVQSGRLARGVRVVTRADR